MRFTMIMVLVLWTLLSINASDMNTQMKDDVLTLKDGTVLKGQLLEVYKEGIYFDPGVQPDFTDPEPQFYPLSTIKKLTQNKYNVENSKQIKSVNERKAPSVDTEEMAGKQKHSFFLRVEYGVMDPAILNNKSLPRDFYDVKYVDFRAALSFDVHMMVNHFGIGLRYLREPLKTQYTLNREMNYYMNYETDNFLVGIMPEVIYRNHFDNASVAVTGMLSISPVIITEPEGIGDDTVEKDGLMYYTNWGLEYWFNSYVAIGVNAGFSDFIFNDTINHIPRLSINSSLIFKIN